MIRRLLFLSLLAATLAAGCSPDPEPQQPIDEGQSTAELPEEDSQAVDPGPDRSPEEQLLQRADSTVHALAREDWDALAELAHPEDSVRFSPYSYVDTTEHLAFGPAALRHFDRDTTTYRWGVWDGRGTPIQQTISEYYDRFLYDRDYVEAQRGAPDEQLGQGNTINNIHDAFGGEVRYVEYHHPGTEEYDGMDWRSLRVVFRREADRWHLVGLVHDEWTI